MTYMIRSKKWEQQKNRYMGKRNDMPMEVFYDTFDIPTPQEIEPCHSSIKKRKQNGLK